MDYSSHLETIKIDNFNRKLRNELDYLSANGNMNIFANASEIVVEERIKQLGELLNEVIEIRHEETVQQKRDNMMSEIEKYTYRKQWAKLPSFHKEVKIKQYIDTIYGEGKMQSEIINKLNLYAQEGKIGTKKFVIYDPSAEKILDMPCLVIDNAKNTYQIKGI